MSIEISKISEGDAITLLKREEDHFFDVISKDYSGESLQKKCVSFANVDGGEIIVGLLDKKSKNLSGGIFERWSGFTSIEEANNTVVDILNNIKPSIPKLSLEFLEVENRSDIGFVLKIFIDKSSFVHETARGNIYLRQSSQCVLLKDQQKIVDLKLSKGEFSYENQLIEEGYSVNRLIESEELEDFLKRYSPKTDSENFLKKQLLIQSQNSLDRALFAGVLLYDENPSVVLAKKCAIKINRYDTSEQDPERDHLSQQETIEGPLHKQIIDSLSVIYTIIESVPVMSAQGLINAKYPREAIHEVLVNAIIHRDYNVSDDVMVHIFNNRIEVHSPGSLPGHITVKNILKERFSRNAKLVRLLNKYPDKPNRDIGEGLNTTFQKMREVRLKDPIIESIDNRVIVTLPHEELASPEEQILEYLKTHYSINNSQAREITNIRSESSIQKNFDRLRKAGLITLDPAKHGSQSAWIKNEDAFVANEKSNEQNKTLPNTLF